jgi:hypothetical protein
MSTWRARLAVLRDEAGEAECVNANSAISANRLGAGAIGTIGTNGIGTNGGEDRGDHDAAERDAMLAFNAAPPDPQACQPTDADPLRDGLLMLAGATFADVTTETRR